MSLFLRIIMVVFLALTMSCAAKIPEEEIPELYWPLPPQRPRIKFVDLIIGSLDVTGSQRGKFRRVLFGEEGEVGFVKPLFVDVKNGVVYMTDLQGIKMMDFKKKQFRILGTTDFYNPTGIAVSGTGDIFVADSAKRKIYSVASKTGEVSQFTGDSFGNPGGVAVDDANGRVVVADVRRHVVKIYTFAGENVLTIGNRGSNPGEFNFPYDVAVDSKGNIYVVDSGNFRVQIFDKEGNFIRAFGSVGTQPGQFARPKGIALDQDEHIYVVDGAFGNFQIFDKEGRPLLAVGTVGTEPGQFVLPIGIAIDVDGSIFVVDQLNKRLQQFQYLTYPDER